MTIKVADMKKNEFVYEIISGCSDLKSCIERFFEGTIGKTLVLF